jgi:hypothetical protein
VRLLPATAALALLAGAVLASPPGKSVEALLADMKDEDPEVRLAAREGLRDAGEAAIPALQKLAGGADTPLGRQAKTILRRIEFDKRASKAIGTGVSWFKWTRQGVGEAWVRLEAKHGEHGWTLVETVKTGGVTITQTTETDRDFGVVSIASTLSGDGPEKNEVKASFKDGVCTIEEKGKKDELPGHGTPWTDWSVVRFAAAIAADPPAEAQIVIWDSVEQEPATTNLRIGTAEFTDAPGGRIKAIPVKVEGMLTAWVKEDGTFSHATRGEGSVISAVEEKDVPEEFRK